MGIAEIMGGEPEPEVFQAPQPGSTDWMDGIRTVEDLINKYKLVVWCSACSNWFHFEKDPESTHMSSTHGQTCDCGATGAFIGSSLISERPWTKDRPAPKIVKRRR